MPYDVEKPDEQWRAELSPSADVHFTWPRICTLSTLSRSMLCAMSRAKPSRLRTWKDRRPSRFSAIGPVTWPRTSFSL